MSSVRYQAPVPVAATVVVAMRGWVDARRPSRPSSLHSNHLLVHRR
jgi:hypothetical protein